MNFIDLVFRHRKEGNGAEQSKREILDLQRAVQLVASAFGEVGKRVSAIFKGIFAGGIFEVGARLVTFIGDKIVGSFLAWRESVDKLKEPLHGLLAGTENRLKSIAGVIDVTTNKYASLSKAIDDATKKRRSEIDQARDLLKAEIELQRQRDLAAGQNADEVNRRAAQQLSTVDVQAAEDVAKAGLQAAEARLRMAQEKSAAAGKNLSEAQANRGLIATTMRDAAQKKWNEVYASEMVGFRGGMAKARSYVATARANAAVNDYQVNDANYGKRREQLKQADAQIANASKIATEAEREVKLAEAAVEAAKRQMQIVAIEKQTNELRKANEVDKDPEAKKRKKIEDDLRELADSHELALLQERKANALMNAESDKERSRIAADYDLQLAELKRSQLEKSKAVELESATGRGAKELEKIEIKYAVAMAEANSEIVRAKDAQKRLTDLTKENERLTKAENAQKLREAQERVSSTHVAVGDAQRQAEASQRQADTAWSWYRSPSAWQSQRQEERDEAKAQKQFDKDFDRLQRRSDWRTAQLGDKDELVRRVAIAREQAEFDKERLKLIQADLSKAASALDAIKNTIANGVEL